MTKSKNGKPSSRRAKTFDNFTPKQLGPLFELGPRFRSPESYRGMSGYELVTWAAGRPDQPFFESLGTQLDRIEPRPFWGPSLGFGIDIELLRAESCPLNNVVGDVIGFLLLSTRADSLKPVREAGNVVRLRTMSVDDLRALKSPKALNGAQVVDWILARSQEPSETTRARQAWISADPAWSALKRFHGRWRALSAHATADEFERLKAAIVGCDGDPEWERLTSFTEFRLCVACGWRPGIRLPKINFPHHADGLRKPILECYASPEAYDKWVASAD